MKAYMITALTAAALGSGLAGCKGDEPAAPPPPLIGNFNYPMGIATDGTNLYIADTQNSTIRQVDIATGAIRTLAGTAGQVGSADETGAAARFNSPRYLTIDGSVLYVAGGWDYKVRKVVIGTTEVTKLAGTGAAGSQDSTDSPPTGATALFQETMGITQLGTDLYVIDRGAKVLRCVDNTSGATVSPTLTQTEPFNKPYGIATDGTNLYVANTGNGTILKIDPSMTVTTLAGTAGMFGYDDGTGAAARFMSPTGIVWDGTTNLYVTDTGNSAIRKIDILSGAVTTFAGSTTGETGFDDGTGTAARFKYPFGIATDGPNLYVTDTHNHTIRRIVISSGEVSTIAGIAGEPGSLDSP